MAQEVRMTGHRITLPKGQWRVDKSGKLARVEKRLPPPAEYARKTKRKWKAAK